MPNTNVDNETAKPDPHTEAEDEPADHESCALVEQGANIAFRVAPSASRMPISWCAD